MICVDIHIKRRWSEIAGGRKSTALARRLFCVTAFAVYSFSVVGQHVIQGKVVNEDKQALPYAFVQLVNEKGSRYTNEHGDFIFSDITRDTCQLVINYVGYQSDTLTFSLRNEDTLHTRVILKEQMDQLEQVVITASRTKQRQADVPVPMTVINNKEIREMGAVRLDEVLAEQTGLQVLNDHGTALQMQGMDADHILILIDGEPVIGRTAGTLDLKRLAVGNIERIEVIRGPSSALYGSDALAGVVNIITKKPNKNLDAGADLRYRSFNTWDASLDGQMKRNNFSGSVFLNRLSSSGYDMRPQAVGMTFPAFSAYTLESNLGYKISPKVNASLRLRGFIEQQHNQSIADEAMLDQHFDRREW